MWLAVAATGLKFYSVNPVAGLIFVPYQVDWRTGVHFTFCKIERAKYRIFNSKQIQAKVYQC